MRFKKNMMMMTKQAYKFHKTVQLVLKKRNPKIKKIKIKLNPKINSLTFRYHKIYLYNKKTKSKNMKKMIFNN